MTAFLPQSLINAIPPRPETSVVKWAEKYVRLPGSARSERFDSSITPWTREPIECAGDGVTRLCTFVKPVQSGGSVAGEVALCYILATQNSGDCQYNWEDGDKAGDRYVKRIERIMLATGPVRRRWPKGPHKAQKCLVIFPHCNLTVQGVWSPENLDSDSIRFQFNEEIHNWKPGMLEKARKRTTAFWNSFSMDISNAGVKDDQLYAALHAGTHQKWEVKCPGCGLYHVMRTQWDEKHPELGGLRYDSTGCKREDGYDYNRLESTIRYQMPCGYQFGDDRSIRRALSLSGRYGAPNNEGAHLSHRSFTLEAVSVDYIPFLKLIQEKHTALRSMRRGDPEPWKRYLQERECRFWDAEDTPIAGRIVLTDSLKKDRDGLMKHPKFFARYAALDRQQGSMAKGELPHWWLVIRDVLDNGDSQLVFEGKVETDDNVVEILKRHECVMRCVVADSGDDTMHVYQFCLRNGINAIKGGTTDWYSHGEEGKKIFAPETPLHQMTNSPPNHDYSRGQPHQDEPMFWLYSKKGIRDRLNWLRSGGAVKWLVPDDVSEDYKRHMESEELEHQRVGRSQELVPVWVQKRERNDLFVCECYIAMLMEMAGVIGEGAVAA